MARRLTPDQRFARLEKAIALQGEELKAFKASVAKFAQQTRDALDAFGEQPGLPIRPAKRK